MRRTIPAFRNGRLVADLACSRRILVLGSPGSGKSHLADELARVKGLPVVRLDDLYWDAGWERPSDAEFRARMDTALRRDRWIADGNYLESLTARLKRADAVVLLDRAPAKCLAAVAVRGLRRAAGDQASLPACVRENGRARQRVLVDTRFLSKIASFRSCVRPRVVEAVDACPHVALVLVPDRRAARHLVDDLKAALA